MEQSIEALFGPEQEEAPEKPEESTDTPSEEPVLYISDTDNGRIVVMQGIEGLGFTSVGLPGYGFGRFLRPAQVWVDPRRRLYIADSGNNRVVRVDQRAVKGWTEYKDLSSPMGVCTASDGVYVADTGADRILKLKEIDEGADVLETITHSQMSRPTSLWIDSEGALYACCGEDPPGGKVFKTWIEKDRRRWKIFEGDGLTGSRFRVSSLVTVGKDLKMLDGSGARVLNMSNFAGRRLKELDFRRNRRWRLRRPQGIAVDPTGKRFYIADSGNDRILEVGADGSIVGEYVQTPGDIDSVLRNPSSIFVFSPAPEPEPEKDDDDKKKKK